MKATIAAAPSPTAAGSLSRPTSPLPAATKKTMLRTVMLATALGALGVLGGVALMVGKGKTPAAGSRFLAQRVLVRSSTTPARRLSVPSASLTAPSKGLRAAAPSSAAAKDAAVTYTEAALADEIKSLPGLKEELGFRQFSGYLPISKSKNIFYWYTEAAEAPEEKPLVFWTNGGPGCSGLFGFLNENGPFRPTRDGKSVRLNEYSWNKAANMLFVEQPVTVGFSYTTDDKDKEFGDAQAAEDNYQVIQRFLERFPHLRDRDLHLSGESYAGHYLPTLAKHIVDKNEQAPAAERLNLKGFLVGNPLTDPVENMIGAVDSFWGHSLVPHELYDEWAAKCRGYTGDAEKDVQVLYSPECASLQNDMWAEVRGLNPYALDYPTCEEPGAQQRIPRESAFPPAPEHIRAAGRNQRYKLLAHSLAPFVGGRAALDQASWTRDGAAPGYEPCEDAWAAAYLNRKDVQAAIHAKPPQENNGRWADCSDLVFSYFSREDRHAFMQPIYNYLLEDKKDLGLRIMVFSGTDDSVCATQGTSLWISRQPWAVMDNQEWTAWGLGQQVAGYIQGFTNGFTYATVHGAGHEVPAYRPAAALALFASYLDDSIWKGH